MDWTHAAAFLAPYLPTVGGFLRKLIEDWWSGRRPTQNVTQQQADGLGDYLKSVPTDTLEALVARRKAGDVSK